MGQGVQSLIQVSLGNSNARFNRCENLIVSVLKGNRGRKNLIQLLLSIILIDFFSFWDCTNIKCTRLHFYSIVSKSSIGC